MLSKNSIELFYCKRYQIKSITKEVFPFEDHDHFKVVIRFDFLGKALWVFKAIYNNNNKNYVRKKNTFKFVCLCCEFTKVIL